MMQPDEEERDDRLAWRQFRIALSELVNQEPAVPIDKED